MDENIQNAKALTKIEINDMEIKSKIYRGFKRIVDVILGCIGLVLLSPVFLILAICIKIDSKGPVIFAHKRIGKNGKEFNMYKFKLENDPRITRIGNFLRKTSLDELPQIVNIIRGDLSIIGPRPVTGEELEKYEENKEKFLSITPGLTGYWQANGRSNTTYEERMQMELYYVDNQSLWLDIKIFFKTIVSVVKKEGAM